MWGYLPGRRPHGDATAPRNLSPVLSYQPPAGRAVCYTTPEAYSHATQCFYSPSNAHTCHMGGLGFCTPQALYALEGVLEMHPLAVGTEPHPQILLKVSCHPVRWLFRRLRVVESQLFNEFLARFAWGRCGGWAGYRADMSAHTPHTFFPQSKLLVAR